MDEIEVFEEMFEDIIVEFAIDLDGTKTVKALSVAKAVEYKDPSKAVLNILKRNEEYFEGEVKTYSHRGYVQKYLTRLGLRLFLFFSQQPKAKEFQVWAAKYLEEEQKALEEQSTDFLLAQADRRTSIVLRRHEKQICELETNVGKQKETITTHETRLTTVERTLQEIPITETHKEELSKLVKQIHDLTGFDFGYIWKKLNDKFGVPKPTSNRSRISLALDSQFEAMKDWLENWIFSRQKPLDHYRRENI